VLNVFLMLLLLWESSVTGCVHLMMALSSPRFVCTSLDGILTCLGLLSLVIMVNVFSFLYHFRSCVLLPLSQYILLLITVITEYVDASIAIAMREWHLSMP